MDFKAQYVIKIKLLLNIAWEKLKSTKLSKPVLRQNRQWFEESKILKTGFAFFWLGPKPNKSRGYQVAE